MTLQVEFHIQCKRVGLPVIDCIANDSQVWHVEKETHELLLCACLITKHTCN